MDLLFYYGLLQVVTKPTRCTLHSATLIDHIITNAGSCKYETVIIISQLSDHFLILHFLAHDKIKQKNRSLSKRALSDTNICNFNDSLISMNWTNVTSSADTQSAFDTFSDEFYSLYDTHIPLVTVKFNKNFHKIDPWITKGLLTSRRQKIKLEKFHFNNPSPGSLAEYVTFRNLYNKLLRAAKKLYFEKELRINQSNIKRTWDLIKSALNKKSEKSASVTSILINNCTIEDPELIANHFNNFFTSVAASIVDDINRCDRPPNFLQDDNVPNFSFTNVPLSVNEVLNATKSLEAKKTADITGISVWLIQKIILSISVPLHFIFFNSLSSGMVPQQLKIAKVIPVYKSGPKEQMDNYRPISLLSCFSKIIEKIVCTRLTSFLDINNIISNSQYGLRKKHSTLHPLIHFLNHISSALDQKLHSIAIFCDLRKAFDTVNHDILLKKLSKIGVRGVELLWFKSYLSDRKQLVHINGSNSSLLSILTGVPQGSILGPLLFLIYINDLPLCSELVAYLFADDTTLILSGPDLDLLIANVNHEFKKVADFF